MSFHMLYGLAFRITRASSLTRRKRVFFAPLKTRQNFIKRGYSDESRPSKGRFFYSSLSTSDIALIIFSFSSSCTYRAIAKYSRNSSKSMSPTSFPFRRKGGTYFCISIVPAITKLERTSPSFSSKASLNLRCHLILKQQEASVRCRV